METNNRDNSMTDQVKDLLLQLDEEEPEVNLSIGEAQNLNELADQLLQADIIDPEDRERLNKQVKNEQKKAHI